MMNVNSGLLLAEAALLLAPATMMAILGFAWSARFLVESVRIGNWQDPTTWIAMAIAAGLVGTLSGWWLLVRYLRGGATVLARGSSVAWTGAALGLAAALGGALLAVRGNGWIFSIGLLAVLPLAHLYRLGSGARA